MDERQKAESKLNNPILVKKLMDWVTFWRRNPGRFIQRYFGITLYPYQHIIMYLIGYIPKYLYRCSTKYYWWYEPKYCPNCGALMDGKETHDDI